MFKRSRLNVAALLTVYGLVGTAEAQTAQRVEITGSSIKRIDTETALPVTVITRDQIEKSGAVSVEDLLRRVSANGAGVSDSVQGAGFATSNANLRGLGVSSTLVLLNGRRLANHPFGSVGSTVGVDLNSIPFAALDRIEVLRDGASAVYGSDAVGGVINFITRRDYAGGELTLRAGVPQKRIGGDETGASIAFGKGDINRDNYNLLVTANIQDNKRLKAVDQKLYMRGEQEVPDFFPPTSGRAFPGRLVDYGLTPGAYVSDGSFSDPNLSGCDPTFTATQIRSTMTPSGSPIKRCRFIYAAAVDNLPEQTKADIFARFSYNLGAETQVYAEASYARNHSIGRVAPVPIDSSAGHVDQATGEYPHFAMPVSSKYFPTALLSKLGYTAPFDTIPSMPGMTEIAMRAVPVGNRIDDNTNEQKRAVVGLKGLLSHWEYETGLTYSRAGGDLGYRGYIVEPKFIAALATGKINPFGPMDQTGTDLLNSTLLEGQMRKSSSTIVAADGKASRDLMKLGGGTMAVAVGFDLRRESATDTPVNSDYALGLPIGGGGTVPATVASRNVAAAFAELNLPFAKGWEASLAGRYDHYSDFGSTFNPRGSLRWQPDRSILLRSSIGTGFRAPTLWDVHAPPSITNTANSLVDPDCPKTVDPGDARCNTQFNVRNSSSASLKPEKSRQFSLGAVWEPVKSLSATVDFWSITKTDQIGQVGGDAIFTDPTLYAAYKSRIRRSADGFVSYIETPVENLGGLKTSGVDLSLRASYPSALGLLILEGDGTYIDTWKQQSGKSQPYVSYVNTAGDGAGVQPVPQWQHTLAFELQTASFGVRLENVFVKGWTESKGLVDANVCAFSDDAGCAEHKVKDSSRWNLSGSYSGIKNLTLRLGVRNLFDKLPPYTAVSSYGSHPAGWASSFVDPRGRFFYGTATYRF